MKIKSLLLATTVLFSCSFADLTDAFVQSETVPADSLIGAFYNSTDDDEKFVKSIGHTKDINGVYSVYFTYQDLDRDADTKAPQLKNHPINLVKLNTGYWLIYHVMSRPTGLPLLTL